MNAAKTSADPVGDFRRFFQVFPEEAVVEMSREILELVTTTSYELALLRLKSLKGMCHVDLDPEACNTFMTRSRGQRSRTAGAACEPGASCCVTR